jgi:hypothetical protein
VTDTLTNIDKATFHRYMADIFSQLGTDFAALGNQIDRLEGTVAKLADRVLALENYARIREIERTTP